MTGPSFSPTALLARLADAHVDFVVLGGIAVIAHGHVRTTTDLDVTYALDAANLGRLAGVLSAVGTRLRDIEEDLPFVADVRTLRQTSILTLSTDYGGLDLLVDPVGAPPYAQLSAHALTVDLDGRRFKVVSLADLRSMKRAAGRPQDLADLAALEAIERIGDEEP